MNDIENIQRKNNITSSRFEYVDLFRGIGILLMIAGHVGYVGIIDKLLSFVGVSSFVDKFVHAFHMPMFFFVSGFLFKDGKLDNVNFWNYVKKKARTLIIPYLIFAIFHYIVWLFMNWGERSFEPLLKIFVFNTGGLPIAGALWFLTALFFVDVIVYFLERYAKKAYVKTIVVTLLAIIGILIPLRLSFRLPWGIDISFVALALFYVGKLVRRYGLLERIKAWIIPIFIVIGTLGIYFNPSVNMRKGSYGIAPLFYVNAILASFVLLYLCKIIQEKSGHILGKILKPILKIGNLSIVYVCLNQVVIMLMRLLFSNIAISGYIIRAAVLICSIACLYLIQMIFENTKLKIIFGR